MNQQTDWWTDIATIASDKAQLTEGYNLIYISFGTSDFHSSAIRLTMETFCIEKNNFHLVDASTFSTSQSKDLKDKLKHNSRLSIIAVENAEWVHNSRVSNLMFRVADKTDDIVKIIVLLLFNTDRIANGTQFHSKDWKLALSNHFNIPDSQVNGRALTGRICRAIHQHDSNHSLDFNRSRCSVSSQSFTNLSAWITIVILAMLVLIQIFRKKIGKISSAEVRLVSSEIHDKSVSSSHHARQTATSSAQQEIRRQTIESSSSPESQNFNSPSGSSTDGSDHLIGSSASRCSNGSSSRAVDTVADNLRVTHESGAFSRAEGGEEVKRAVGFNGHADEIDECGKCKIATEAVVGANVDSTVEADFMTHGCNRSSNDNVSTGASGRITRASRRSSTGDASTAISGPKTTHASRRLSSGDAAAATTSGPMTRARAALPTVDAIAVAETSSLTNRLSESPPSGGNRTPTATKFPRARTPTVPSKSSNLGPADGSSTIGSDSLESSHSVMPAMTGGAESHLAVALSVPSHSAPPLTVGEEASSVTVRFIACSATAVRRRRSGQTNVERFSIEEKSEDWSDLHVAVVEGSVERTRSLLLAGADASAATHTQRTPLHFAAALGNVELFRLLLLSGSSDPTIRDCNGITAEETILGPCGAPDKGTVQAMKGLLRLLHE